MIPEARSFPNYLDQNSLRSSAVEFAVEDLLPGPEIELAAADGHHDLAAHDLALVMGVAIVLPGAVMMVGLRRGIEGGQFLQPAFV